MLLTITTTYQPATDLGFLLMKHPDNVHEVELSFGKATLFYPEATDARCTAAITLDVDAVELVRGKGGSADATSLLAVLPPALFGLLDGVTIARSRQHVERHYATSMERIGKFPRRAPPESIFASIDTKDSFPAFEEVDRAIGRLELALYSPLTFVLPEHRALYDKGGNFDQGNREKYLIAMMKSGFLKRLESSVNSFGVTMDRMVARIDRRIYELEEYDETASIEAELNGEEDVDEELEEAFEVGTALKYRLAHVDRAGWKAALLRDRERIVSLADAARQVIPDRDAKLQRLAEIVRAKSCTPSRNRDGESNRKIILFTAYTDTARYLYEQLLPIAEELGLNAGLVTGTECKASLGRPQFQEILVNFAPRAKRRAAMRNAEPIGEIDLLIATDCISEGQNLQDADLLVNVDIHWNPVRLIQRFGRIDRIGSLNDTIRMVNFWPTEELNKYLGLKGRVEARMKLVDLSATGNDDLLVEAQADVRWRDEQLLRLRDEVFDLEEAGGGVTLADFALDDFRAELLGFAKANEQARYFAARTMPTKRKYRGKIETLRDELAEVLETEHSLPHDDAKKAAAWSPFDQNRFAPFFDPLWMFQLHDGFDIVIGNPAYTCAQRDSL